TAGVYPSRIARIDCQYAAGDAGALPRITAVVAAQDAVRRNEQRARVLRIGNQTVDEAEVEHGCPLFLAAFAAIQCRAAEILRGVHRTAGVDGEFVALDVIVPRHPLPRRPAVHTAIDTTVSRRASGAR